MIRPQRLHFHCVCCISSVLYLGPANGAEFQFSDRNLHFDQVPDPKMELHFEDEDKLEIVRSRFMLVDYVLMSSGLGERWALVTVKNPSTGRRALKGEHLIATFANGKEAYAQFSSIWFDGGETRSQAVPFGVSRFPVLKVEVR